MRIKEREKEKKRKVGKSESANVERSSALVVKEKESATLRKEGYVVRVSMVRRALVL